MKTKLKKTSKRKPAGRVRALAVDAGSAFPTFVAGQVLEYKHGSCKYRVEVAAQAGPIIFAHAVFTTGAVQREGHGIQSLDVRDLDLQVVEGGKPWDNGYHREPKRFSC